MWGQDHRRQQVARLEEEIQRLIVDRRPEEAVPLQHTAIALVREIISQQSTPGPDDLRMLGALLYGLGTSVVSVAGPTAALGPLAEAEECYRTLLDDGDAGMQQRIADVKLRRARILQLNGRLALAILESAAALDLMTPPADDGAARVQFDLHRARVLAANATILAEYGDPDLASESADAAIRLILLRGAQINVSGEANFYVDILRDAATLAQKLHASQGRTEVALAAGAVAVDTFELASAGRVVPLTGRFTPVPDFRRRQLAVAAMQHGLLLVSAGREAEGVDQIAFARSTDRESADRVEDSWSGVDAGPISLATALRTARQVLGAPQVPDDLLRLAPPTGLPGSPLTPSERCAPPLRDLLAGSLATVSNALPRDSVEALRIGFEANCLYAVSSSENQADVSAWHEKNARPWGQLLYALIEACEEQGDVRLGSEFKTWFGVAASVVDPFSDPQFGARNHP